MGEQFSIFTEISFWVGIFLEGMLNMCNGKTSFIFCSYHSDKLLAVLVLNRLILAFTYTHVIFQTKFMPYIFFIKKTFHSLGP